MVSVLAVSFHPGLFFAIMFLVSIYRNYDPNTEFQGRFLSNIQYSNILRTFPGYMWLITINATVGQKF